MAFAVESHAGIQQGDAVVINGRKCVVSVLDTLPFVDNAYTRAMVWQKPEPRLQQIHDELRLDDKIAPGRDELDRQLHLLESVSRQWEYGDPREFGSLCNPLEILELQKREQRFYCVQYASMLVGAAASEGWVYRLLTLLSHTFGEMWSNEYKKWMFFDPTVNLWAEKDGIPQTTAEVLDDYFKTGLRTVTIYSGTAREKTNVRRRFADYTVVEFVPNTDLLDQGPQWQKTFCMINPNANYAGEPAKASVANHLVDPYFPINQAALTLEPTTSGIAVTVRTLTPNFKAFRCRVDGTQWLNCGANFTWPLHGGKNALEVKSVNAFEVDGPISRVQVEMEGAGEPVSLDSIGTAAPEEESKVCGMPALKSGRTESGELVPVECEPNLKNEWLSKWHTKAQWVEWTADVPAPGDYTASVVYSESYYPRRELQVNGKIVPGLESFTMPSTGGSRMWKKVILPVNLALNAGKNTLRLTCLDETSLWLKEIRLSRAGVGDVALDAFDFTAEGGGKVQKTFIPTNGFFSGWDAKGHWVEWNVDAAGGDYSVFLSVGALSPAVRDMRINGVLIDNPDQFRISPTGGWRTWTEIPFGRAKLHSGNNVIRMENLNGEGMNLNEIRFVNSAGQVIEVNAVDFTAEGGGRVIKMR